MPFLLLDDATDEATRRLTQFGQNLLQPPQPPAQTQQTDSLQDITGRLQDFGSQQLQTLQQLNQPPFPTTAGQPPPIPGVTLPQPPSQLVQLNQPPFAGAAPGAPSALPSIQQIQPQGVTDITQRLQDHGSQVLQAAQQQLQQLPQVQPIAPISGPPAPGQPQAGGDLQDYARQVANKYGIDPDIFVRQIQQESGFNPGARSPAGATGIAQFMPDTARGMGIDPSDPYAALDAAARLDASNLSKYGGDYSKALAAYNAGGGNVDKYGGVPPFSETQNYVSTILGGAKQAVQGAVQGAQQAVQGAVQGGQQVLGQISQFGDKQLSAAEAYAACGPAAAVRFAQMFGRQPTLREAVDLASSVGWTAAQGMAGLGSESALFDKMGIPHRQVGADWQALAREAQSGNPVTISTPGHYFTADNYDPSTGAFHVGSSGTDLRGGGEWMTPSQMEARMGQLQGGLAVDNPQVPGDSPLSVGAMASNPLMPSNLVSRGMQILGQAVQPETRQALGRALQQAPAPSDRDISLISGLPELPGLAGVARFGTQALGGLLAQPSALEAVGTIDRVNRKMLDDPSSITDADRADLQQAQMIVGGLTGAPESGTTRMYHGTGADFPSVSPEAVSGEGNLFGPGYYMTTSPDVAGGRVSRGQIGINPETGRTSEYDPTTGKFTTYMTGVGELQAPGYAQARTQVDANELADLLQSVHAEVSGDAGYHGYFQQSTASDIRQLAAGAQQLADTGQMRLAGTPMSGDSAIQYIQNRLEAVLSRDVPNPETYLKTLRPDIFSRGGNVRALDVPSDLNLLNIEGPVSDQTLRDIGSAVTRRTGDPVDGQSFVVNVRSQNPGGVTGSTVYTALQNYVNDVTGFGPTEHTLGVVNNILADAGLDGITYAGGKRIPMRDAAGNAIEHQATVIFPENVAKIRNAVSGTMGGAAQAGYAAGLGGAAAGLAGAGALLGDGLGDVRDKAQAVADSLQGFTAGARVPSELTENPLMPSNILAGAARSFGYQPALQSAMDKLRSGQELTPEENTAFGDAVRMLAIGAEQAGAGVGATAERAAPAAEEAAARAFPKGVTQALVDAAHQRIDRALDIAAPSNYIAHDQLDQLLASNANPGEIARFMAGVTGQGVTKLEMLRSLRTGAMAGGLSTEAKVAASPFIQTALRAPAGAVNLLLQGRAGDIPAGLAGGMGGLVEGARDALQTMRYGTNYGAALTGGPAGGYGFSPGLDVLGQNPLTRTLGTGLIGLVRTHGAISDISAGIGRGANLALGASPEAAAEAGQQWALRSGQYGTIGSAVDDAMRALRGRNPALDVASQILLPFYRVGYNVFTQGVERSPLGLGGRVIDALQGKPFDRAKLVNNLFGVGLAGLAFTQAAQGNITGERPEGGDPKQSIRVGGQWLPLRALGPASEPLAQAAALYESARDNEGDVPGMATQLASEYAKHVADETWLSSLADAMNVVGAVGNISSASAPARAQAQRELGYQVGQYAKSFIPQEKLGEQIAGALGFTAPSTSSGGGGRPGKPYVPKPAVPKVKVGR